MAKISVNKEKCIHCGLCITDCLTKCLQFDEDNIPHMTNEASCISCGHCSAVCPEGALQFNNRQGENIAKNSNPNPEEVLNLIKSRRSIRQYKNEEISEELMHKIKEMLPYIPTGCNSHSLYFSIVEKKEVMEILKTKVNHKLLKILNNKAFSPIATKFEKYKKAFLEGEDVIFRGAPHLIVVSSPITAPCATVDPIIALSYIELYANSLGLGTCWCGYAQICMKLFPELCEIMEIPSGYAPIYAMLLGYPDIKYKRYTSPEPYKIAEIKDVNNKGFCLFCKTKRLITNFLR